MANLTVFAYGPCWRLLDEGCAEIGVYGSQAEALAAAGGYGARPSEPRHVLVQDAAGWREELVTPAPARSTGAERPARRPDAAA